MAQNIKRPISRRRFLKTASATALAAGTGPAVIIPGRAQPKTLTLLTIKQTVAGLDNWFRSYAANWGEQNNTQVVVDIVGQDELHGYADAEVAAQQGHDLVYIPWGAAAYEEQVIDHRDIYRECERRYGKAHDIALRSTYNSVSDKFIGLAGDFLTFPVNYRKDLWDRESAFPDTWDDVRLGGRRIKFSHDHPVGISLAPVIDANTSLRAILYSFGGSVQDVDHKPVLKSKQTLEALRFVKALYEEAMTEEVLTWDGIANNRSMLAGDISLTLNSPNITRSGENLGLEVAEHIWLAPPPRGPEQRWVPSPGLDIWVIWQFAQNKDIAGQFLVDIIGHSQDIAVRSGFYLLPVFPGTAPDLKQIFGHDPKAKPPDKYRLLADALDWTTNAGYPGYDNPAISEIFNTNLVPIMFASAATGKMTPEESLTQADQEVRKIYDKWRGLGKV